MIAAIKSIQDCHNGNQSKIKKVNDKVDTSDSNDRGSCFLIITQQYRFQNWSPDSY